MLWIIRFLAISFIFGAAPWCCAEVVLSENEARDLKAFFLHVIIEHEAGYVIEGVKPVSILGIEEKSDIFAGFPNHKTAVILRRGLAIWNAKFADSNPETNLFLRSYESEDSVCKGFRHVLFVNKQLFLKTVEENLHLFRYILGPLETPSSIYTDLIASKKDFSEVFGGHNKVLVGIILGYGTDNALLVSRVEEGFSSLSEYVQLPPEPLVSEKPHFIYGCIKKDPFSESLNSRLILAQKKIQQLSNDPEVLNKIIFLFTGKKIKIESSEDKNIEEKSQEELFALGFLESLYNNEISLSSPMGNVKLQDFINFHKTKSKFNEDVFMSFVKKNEANPRSLNSSERELLDRLYFDTYM